MFKYFFNSSRKSSNIIAKQTNLVNYFKFQNFSGKDKNISENKRIKLSDIFKKKKEELMNEKQDTNKPFIINNSKDQILNLKEEKSLGIKEEDEKRKKPSTLKKVYSPIREMKEEKYTEKQEEEYKKKILSMKTKDSVIKGLKELLARGQKEEDTNQQLKMKNRDSLIPELKEGKDEENEENEKKKISNFNMRDSQKIRPRRKNSRTNNYRSNIIENMNEENKKPLIMKISYSHNKELKEKDASEQKEDEESKKKLIIMKKSISKTLSSRNQETSEPKEEEESNKKPIIMKKRELLISKSNRRKALEKNEEIKKKFITLKMSENHLRKLKERETSEQKAEEEMKKQSIIRNSQSTISEFKNQDASIVKESEEKIKQLEEKKSGSDISKTIDQEPLRREQKTIRIIDSLITKSQEEKSSEKKEIPLIMKKKEIVNLQLKDNEASTIKEELGLKPITLKKIDSSNQEKIEEKAQERKKEDAKKLSISKLKESFSKKLKEEKPLQNKEENKKKILTMKKSDYLLKKLKEKANFEENGENREIDNKSSTDISQLQKTNFSKESEEFDKSISSFEENIDSLLTSSKGSETLTSNNTPKRVLKKPFYSIKEKEKNDQVDYEEFIKFSEDVDENEALEKNQVKKPIMVMKKRNKVNFVKRLHDLNRNGFDSNEEYYDYINLEEESLNMSKEENNDSTKITKKNDEEVLRYMCAPLNMQKMEDINYKWQQFFVSSSRVLPDMNRAINNKPDNVYYDFIRDIHDEFTDKQLLFAIKNMLINEDLLKPYEIIFSFKDLFSRLKSNGTFELSSKVNILMIYEIFFLFDLVEYKFKFEDISLNSINASILDMINMLVDYQRFYLTEFKIEDNIMILKAMIDKGVIDIYSIKKFLMNYSEIDIVNTLMGCIYNVRYFNNEYNLNLSIFSILDNYLKICKNNNELNFIENEQFKFLVKKLFNEVNIIIFYINYLVFEIDERRQNFTKRYYFQ